MAKYNELQTKGEDPKFKGCMDALAYDFAYILRKTADQIDGGWED
jgi:hypothetical protein